MQERVEELLKNALGKNESLFLIDLHITPDNQIRIVLDGDQGVSVEDCVSVSRAIEHQLDSEGFDFALTVMSAGLSEPLTLPRQYQKNIGRELKITTVDGKQIKGKVAKATEEDCTLVWTVREPKPVGKGKVTVEKKAVVPYENIKEAKVIITF